MRSRGSQLRSACSLSCAEYKSHNYASRRVSLKWVPMRSFLIDGSMHRRPKLDISRPSRTRASG